jgi:hypothetical protein
VFVESTEAAGESRNRIRRMIGGLGEVVWAQWDEVRHAAALPVAGLAAFRRGKSGSADVVNHYDGHFHTRLTDAEKADLVEYLKSL